MNFKSEMDARTAEVQEILCRFLPSQEGCAHALAEAMRYSLLSGGKRLRPILMWETYRLFGGEGRVVEPFLAAIEMIHAHSLVHDDLPALDNDDYRRGQQTTHVAYGEAMAILAGDALLNLAYETACRAFFLEPDHPHIARAMSVLAEKAGIGGMLGGQAADVQAAGQPVDAETLAYIHRNKTGALIEAAMEVGALLAGASEADVRAIGRVAADVGMAFQICDDILDVTGSTAEIGKPAGSDARNQKTTYVTLYGLAAAQEEAARLHARAMETLRALPGENAFLEELIRRMATRKK